MQEKNAPRTLIYRLVALGFFVMVLSTCIKSVYQVYFSDLADHFSRGRSAFAWSGSLFMLVTGLVSPFVGLLSDRHGPMHTVLLGTLAGGAALVCAGLFPDSLTVFVLAYGLLGAFGLAAMTYVPMGVLVDRLFGSRSSGFAFAVVTNGTSIGFIVLSPIWLWLQPQVQWTQAFVSTGLLLLAASLVVWFASKKASAAGLASPLGEAETQFSVWRQVRSDKGFYALAIGFFGCGATMAFIDVHLVAFWQGAFAPRALMGLSLSVLGLLELISGVATAWLSMRYKKHTLLSIFYLLRCSAMLMLLCPNATVYTLLFAVVFGASYLGTVVLTSMYCLERYGLRIKGQAFGLLFLTHQVGAFASVQLGAVSYDYFGNYLPVVLPLCLLTVTGALAARFFLRTSVSVDTSAGYNRATAS